MSPDLRKPPQSSAKPMQAILYACDTPASANRKPQEQIVALRQTAASLGWTVARAYEDVAPARLQRKRMLSQVAVTETGTILAVGLPYLFASFSDFLDTMHEVHLHGSRLVLLEDDLDTASKAGRKLLGSLELFRQIEGTLRAAHARVGANTARAAGRQLGRPPNNPERKSQAAKLLEEGLGVNQVARQLEMPKSEISRIRTQMAKSQ